MAARVDLDASTATLRRGLTAAVDLAHVIRDTIHDRELAGAAHTHAAGAGDPGTLRTAVGVRYLHHDRHITVPDPVRDALLTHADAVLTAVRLADSAGTVLDTRPAVSTPPRQASGRDHETRVPPTLISCTPALRQPCSGLP